MATHDKSTIEDWIKCIRQWYPDLHTKTYFLPPFHFHRVHYEEQMVADKKVFVLPDLHSTNMNHSDVREDRTMELLLSSLRALGKEGKEVMMVISWLQFHNYLNKISTNSPTAYLPRITPFTGKKKSGGLRQRGRFDILIIHKQYSLISIKVKSLGSDISQTVDTSMIVKCVQEAISQLEKTGNTLKYLVSDVPDVKVISVMALPYITSSQLTLALHSNSEVEKRLSECLGVHGTADSMQFCLCKDNLLTGDLQDDNLATNLPRFRDWWRRCVCSNGQPSCMTSSSKKELSSYEELSSNKELSSYEEFSSNKEPSSYEELVARFCGPATTVEIFCIQRPRLVVRTMGDGLAEVGKRRTQLVLCPEQIDLLSKAPDLAFLTGPPGTGKTTVLVMQGLQWLKKGYDVHVVSTWTSSRAVSYVIECQLLETRDYRNKSESMPKGQDTKSVMDITPPKTSHVYRHHYNFESEEGVNKALIDLVKASEPTASDDLVKASEPTASDDLVKASEPTASDDIVKANKSTRPLCILADEAGPDQSENFKLFCDKLLHQATTNVRHWAATVYLKFVPPCFQERTFVFRRPLRLPSVVAKEVKQAPEMQKHKVVPDYTDGQVSIPEADIIWIKHRDGESGHIREKPHDCSECGCEIARILHKLGVNNKHLSPLKYRNVLVLNEEPDEDCGLVQGLRASKVPVRVVTENDDDGIRDTALAEKDVVTFTNRNYIRGLEANVVVATGLKPTDDNYKTDRLHTISRTTAQLVWINW